MKGESPVAEEELLSEEQVIRERFVFGMRKLQGVDLGALDMARHPDLRTSILTQIEQHIEQGWMEYRGERVALTEAGLWVSDSLWRYYL